MKVEDFLQESKELGITIGEVRDKAQSLLAEIDLLEKKALSERDRYNDSLSEGNEEAMASALANIRAARSQSKELQAKFNDLNSNLPDFRARQKDFATRIRAVVADAEEGVREARQRLVSVQKLPSAMMGILDEINQLNNLLTERRFHKMERTNDGAER